MTTGDRIVLRAIDELIDVQVGENSLEAVRRVVAERNTLAEELKNLLFAVEHALYCLRVTPGYETKMLVHDLKKAIKKP